MSAAKRMRRSEPEPGDGAPEDAANDQGDELTDTAVMRQQIRKELRTAIGSELKLSTRTGLGGIIAYLATIGLQQSLPAVEQYDSLAVLFIMWLITKTSKE